MTVHPFIEAEKQSNHNVKRACELLKDSRTAFYARLGGTCGPRAVRDLELTVTTVPAPQAAARPGPVGRDFAPDAAALDIRWCGDITY
ncbi:hypothetical protein [Streptomyces sp. NPDC008121]|uniref:hypothetical protein n=1 Tax=Streptomyces sp. NPDC008121 TaxID=3364809 RepID=UPI0036EE1697